MTELTVIYNSLNTASSCGDVCPSVCWQVIYYWYMAVLHNSTDKMLTVMSPRRFENVPHNKHQWKIDSVTMCITIIIDSS